MGFLEDVRKITDDSKKERKVLKMAEVEKEADKIIEIIKKRLE